MTDDDDYPVSYLAYVLIFLVVLIVVMIGGAALSDIFVLVETL